MLWKTKYISVDLMLVASARSCGQKPALGHTIKYYMYVGSLGEFAYF